MYGFIESVVSFIMTREECSRKKMGNVHTDQLYLNHI